MPKIIIREHYLNTPNPIGYSAGPKLGMFLKQTVTTDPTGSAPLIGIQILGNIPNVTGIDYRPAVCDCGIRLRNSTNLTEVLAPNLQSVDATGNANGTIFISGCPNLGLVRFPLLTKVNNILNITGITVPTSIELPSLTTVGVASLPTGAFLQLNGNSVMTFIDLANLKNVYGTLNVSNCSLISLDLSSFLPTNGNTITFANNALADSSVNHVLARCVASAGFVSGQVFLFGGTNATPTGQGLLDRATLIGRGVTVLTN